MAFPTVLVVPKADETAERPDVSQVADFFAAAVVWVRA
jgi:hypothetical protein